MPKVKIQKLFMPKTAKAKPKPKSKPKAKSKPIATVTHYYGNIGVAVVKFKQPFSRGKSLHFLGATTDFEQTVNSMQYDHKPVEKAKKGQEVGIKVKKKVREGDEVYGV